MNDDKIDMLDLPVRTDLFRASLSIDAFAAQIMLREITTTQVEELREGIQLITRRLKIKLREYGAPRPMLVVLAGPISDEIKMRLVEQAEWTDGEFSITTNAEFFKPKFESFSVKTRRENEDYRYWLENGKFQAEDDSSMDVGARQEAVQELQLIELIRTYLEVREAGQAGQEQIRLWKRKHFSEI